MIIDHRDYYTHGRIEAIDAIESACTGLTGSEGFLTGNVLKYMVRWRWKGTAVADLRKARYYLDRLVAEQEKALGYTRLVTYILETESGTSLMASGWHRVCLTAGGSWSCPSRPREDKAPTCRKVRWEADL